MDNKNIKSQNLELKDDNTEKDNINVVDNEEIKSGEFKVEIDKSELAKEEEREDESIKDNEENVLNATVEDEKSSKGLEQSSVKEGFGLEDYGDISYNEKKDTTIVEEKKIEAKVKSQKKPSKLDFMKRTLYKKKKVENPNKNKEVNYVEVYKNIKLKKKRQKQIIMFLLLLSIIGSIIFLTSSYFNIKNVDVEGNHYFTKKEIITMANPDMDKNIFFKLDKSVIKERLMKTPYIEDVNIKRKLPNTIVIQLKERTQIATLGYGDRHLVIDNEGRLLRRTEVQPKLTEIEGLKITGMEVGEFLDVVPKRKMETALEILDTAHKYKLFYKKLDMSKPVIRAYIYDEFIVKGTEDRIISSMKEGQLQKVVADLFKNNISRGVINVGGDGYISFSPNTNEG